MGCGYYGNYVDINLIAKQITLLIINSNRERLEQKVLS